MSRLQTPIRRNDTVIVTTGKDSGKRGRVLKVLPAKNRLIVEGVNIIKRHTKPRTLRDTQRAQELGGIIEKEGPIHVSNVMVLDSDGRPTRVGARIDDDGQKVRISRRSGKDL